MSAYVYLRSYFSIIKKLYSVSTYRRCISIANNFVDLSGTLQKKKSVQDLTCLKLKVVSISYIRN